MLAPLLALALAAGSGSGSAAAPDRCARIWKGVEAGKDFQQDVAANLLHGDQEKLARLRGKFVEFCQELPESELGCGEKHKGPTIFRDCPGLGRAFQAAATDDAVVGNPELSKLRAEGLAREALTHLRELGQAARQLRLQSGPSAEFEFPKTVQATPLVDCCETPSHACGPDARLWTNPTWKALGFAPTEPTRFHYSFTSGGTGKDAHFVVRAEGDPLCDGHRIAFEVTGKRQENQFVVSDVEKR